VGSEQGFTLIELLVVLLILGILAAIAIPSFLNQKGKAADSAAKSAVRTARTAIEVYAVDHDGSYAGATPTDLREIEPKLTQSPSDTLSVSGATATGFTVAVTSTEGRTFRMVRVGGTITRTCDVPASLSPGGCVGGSW
jgi:type IV pilus assembly protein PilA